MTISRNDVINVCKSNRVKKNIISNFELDQNYNNKGTLSERYLYKIFIESDKNNCIKKNEIESESDCITKNEIESKSYYKKETKNNENLPSFINKFLENYNLSTFNIDGGDSFLKSVLYIIDNEFISLTDLAQKKVLNIVKKELAIKFIENKYSKEFSLRKYKLTKTDIQRILLNDEPLNLIIKQYISLFLNLNILVANEDNQSITSLYDFKKHNGTIILGFKNNIYYPIIIENENFIYLPLDKINNYKLISTEKDEINLDSKYTSKDLNKFKLNEIHIIAKNMDLSILDENNKKKVKNVLIEEIINNY